MQANFPAVGLVEQCGLMHLSLAELKGWVRNLRHTVVIPVWKAVSPVFVLGLSWVHCVFLRVSQSTNWGDCLALSFPFQFR